MTRWFTLPETNSQSTWKQKWCWKTILSFFWEGFLADCYCCLFAGSKLPEFFPVTIIRLSGKTSQEIPSCKVGYQLWMEFTWGPCYICVTRWKLGRHRVPKHFRPGGALHRTLCWWTRPASLAAAAAGEVVCTQWKKSRGALVLQNPWGYHVIQFINVILLMGQKLSTNRCRISSINSISVQ